MRLKLRIYFYRTCRRNLIGTAKPLGLTNEASVLIGGHVQILPSPLTFRKSKTSLLLTRLYLPFYFSNRMDRGVLPTYIPTYLTPPCRLGSDKRKSKVVVYTPLSTHFTGLVAGMCKNNVLNMFTLLPHLSFCRARPTRFV